jgi:hypothetical protein
MLPVGQRQHPLTTLRSRLRQEDATDYVARGDAEKTSVDRPMGEGLGAGARRGSRQEKFASL